MKILGWLKPLLLTTAAALLMGVFSNGTAAEGEKTCPELPKGKSVYDAPDPLPPMTTAETIMAQYAMTITFPELQLSDVLTPFGIDFVKESAKCQCSKHMGDSLVYMQAWKGTATRLDPQNQGAWIKRIEQMALGNVPSQVPIAIYQGDDDPAIFPAATEAYVKKAWASGTAISYNHYADTDHIKAPSRAQSDFLNWIADRFAGKPAPSSCK